ncbi:mitochondrial inner membrane protease subunit 1 [Kluyveromyces marxianus]|nr:mitochondrial inner membrane protease subunit 1 [Kluyveromyces marxianus]
MSWLKISSYVVRTVCLVHITHAHFYEFTETRGESMLPTLNSVNDYVHVLKWYKDGRDLSIGDCIVAMKPTDPQSRVCKRITGMEGDLILVDPSQNDDEEAFDTFIKVPKGHVWVTGDNLSHSLDSRTYNSIPMGLIKGKIVAANDFNKPLSTLWGFRYITNNFVDETEG